MNECTRGTSIIYNCLLFYEILLSRRRFVDPIDNLLSRLYNLVILTSELIPLNVEYIPAKIKANLGTKTIKYIPVWSSSLNGFIFASLDKKVKYY